MEQKEKHDEKTLSRILKRAAELEARTGKAESSSGYSLAEIESIASGAGISTDSIGAAAAELAESEHGVLQAFLGSSLNPEERYSLDTTGNEDLVQRLAADLPSILPAGGIMGGMGIGAGVGVGIGALGSPLFTVIVPVASLGISWLLARGIFRLGAQQTRSQLKWLVSDVQDIARR